MSQGYEDLTEEQIRRIFGPSTFKSALSRRPVETRTCERCNGSFATYNASQWWCASCIFVRDEIDDEGVQVLLWT